MGSWQTGRPSIAPRLTVATVTAACCLAASLHAASPAGDRRPTVHIDRDTTLDRTEVTFLKGLMKDRPTGLERLIVLGPDGQVLAATDGSESEVSVPAFDRSLLADGEGVTLVHAHPSSTSFSRADLTHLSRPGVEAVVIVGADGSVYLAARGRRFVVNGVGPLYDSASAGAEDMWRSAGRWQAGPNVNPAPHFAHIICQALASAGVIVYRARLPFDRERTYFDGTIVFALMVESATCDIREGLER